MLFVQDVLLGVRPAGTKAQEVGACLAKGKVVGPRGGVQLAEIESIVFPKTDRADVVLPTRREREVVAGWTLKFAHANVRKFGNPPNEIGAAF
jgi:hypothetical protein